MTIVAFVTFGLQSSICKSPKRTFPYTTLAANVDVFAVSGEIYAIPPAFVHPGIAIDRNAIGGKDLTFLFPNPTASCAKVGVTASPLSCTSQNVWPIAGVAVPPATSCHPVKGLSAYTPLGQTFFPWSAIDANSANPSRTQLLVVYSGLVLDVTKYQESPQFLGSALNAIVMGNIGKDITHYVMAQGLKAQADCLSDVFAVAFVDTLTAGCFVSSIILYVSLIFIGGVVIVRFLIALFYGLFLGWKLGDHDKTMLNTISSTDKNHTQDSLDRPSTSNNRQNSIDRSFPNKQRQGSLDHHSTNRHRQDSIDRQSLYQPSTQPSPHPSYQTSACTADIMDNPNLMHTLVMVPCYSESLESMKTTIQSIVDSDYPATHKCIFVVADGVVQGSGNAKPTFEFVIDMMDIDHRFSNEDPSLGLSPPSYSYVAIADGAKRKNLAKVYAGWYKTSTVRTSRSSDTLNSDTGTTDEAVQERRSGRVPMILVVKVGNEEEQQPGQKKAGNRGKRDSQVILMNFLSKVMFDDRMTELEFDIFYKLYTVTGVIPDRYEAVMMVDADTRIYTSALRHLIAAMVKDPDVIGICGETRVGNKWQSWVTMIQVFEYHISHNLAKAFETVFGVVTCLPGCFSVYRVSAPKGHGFCVPVLANPDIVEEYSENVVDTLHKKNLLLLGEDRYLSTLMLKAFPKRKMLYIPNAVCETIVPDEFAVLLSQRRRWINSTIHNLLELVQVQNLCGIFCFSMQVSTLFLLLCSLSFLWSCSAP